MGGCLRCLGPWVIEACGESRHPGPRDLGHGARALATWLCSRTASHRLGGVLFSFPAPTAGTSVPRAGGEGGGHGLARQRRELQGETPTAFL